MTVVPLEAQDLDHLEELVPDLSFDDDERREALLENASRDFNAVPGSGKTSLLAAKLLLLAKKWSHTRRGICILSHTNVAREEITRRLANSSEGAKLLSYPHFIGTIHGFINQFLAMAELRRRDIKVDVIDDNVFAERAWFMVMRGSRYSTLRTWLSRQRNAEDLIKTLYYKGAELEVVSERGKLPSANSTTYKQMVALKKALEKQGIFRHRDMFAYAEQALAENPRLLDVVHRRFPMVFIDEMQDTSGEQEYLLNRLFDRRSTVQRFGDIDQKIISSDLDSDTTTFPRAGYGTISTSKRFGRRIAAAVEAVRVSRLPVNGEATDKTTPVLMLYNNTNINRVIHRFGELVIDRFAESELNEQSVRAMCARRSGEGKVEPGRHMVDYWPSFDRALKLSDKDNLQALLQNQVRLTQFSTLYERVSEVRRAILMVLRAAKSPFTEGVRDGRSLIRAVREFQVDATLLQKLIRRLALSTIPLESSEDWAALSKQMFDHVTNLLPDGMTLEEFSAIGIFSSLGREAEPVSVQSPTVCTVIKSGQRLDYSLGTVASMKGETHIASLVLESYGGRSRRFDLALALPFIAGIDKNFQNLSSTQIGQMRNLYVAMSRPRDFLCLAVNEERVQAKTIGALEAKGWEIERLSMAD